MLVTTQRRRRGRAVGQSRHPLFSQVRWAQAAGALIIAGTASLALAGPAGAEPPNAPVAQPVAAGNSAARQGDSAIVLPAAIPPGVTTAQLAALAVAEIHQLNETGALSAQREYEELRAQVATLVGWELGIDPARFVAAWSSADITHQTALFAAFSQLGVPYRSMASKPGVGFDCSGLTSYAWSVAGHQIPRSSGTQIRAAAPRTLETAQAGDIVYYPGHVSMFLGVDATMVHSPQPGEVVEVGPIPARKVNSVKVGNPIG